MLAFWLLKLTNYPSELEILHLDPKIMEDWTNEEVPTSKNNAKTTRLELLQHMKNLLEELCLFHMCYSFGFHTFLDLISTPHRWIWLRSCILCVDAKWDYCGFCIGFVWRATSCCDWNNFVTQNISDAIAPLEKSLLVCIIISQLLFIIFLSYFVRLSHIHISTFSFVTKGIGICIRCCLVSG